MTAFGQARRSSAQGTVEVSISSVNRRYLEVQVQLPEAHWQLETDLRKELGAYAQRGMIKIQVRVHEAGGQQLALLQQRAQIWESLAAALGPRWNHELSLQLLATPLNADEESATEGWRGEILAATKEALQDWQRAKREEGSRLASDLKVRLEAIRALVQEASRWVESIPAKMAEQFHEKLRTMGTLTGEERERIWRELAQMIDKADASEECVRLQSHLDKLVGLLQEEGEVGKAVEFYLQELLREANTLGSKLGQVRWGHTQPLDLSVQLKTELERMREQVQNLE